MLVADSSTVHPFVHVNAAEQHDGNSPAAKTRSTVFTFQHAAQAIRDGQPLQQVVRNLMSEMTNTERLSLLDGDVPFWTGLRGILCDRYNRNPFIFGAIDRLGIPGIRFTDGPRGVVMGASTAFPVPMARGATWDVELERRVGNVIGLEAKAQGANLFAGVCINLPRHPAWGRIQETYSENPLLLGEFGLALSQGVQKYVMACVKHFALNSIENTRFRVDVDVAEDVLHEVYLPHFKRVIVDGCIASVMSAYNSVRGEWCGQSKELLTNILRTQWGSSAFVMSDFIFGLRDVVLSVRHGLDIEAPFSQQRVCLKDEIDAGKLDQVDIDSACSRILSQQLHFAAMNDDKSKADPHVVFCEQHRSLAREVAAHSMTLLKNNKLDDGSSPILPLQITKIRKIAVVGRLANTANIGDKGSSQVFPPRVVTYFEGLKAALLSQNIEVILDDSDSAESAAILAAKVDVVLCIVGYDACDEGEYVVPSLKHDPSLKDLLPPAISNEDKEMLDVIQGANRKSDSQSALEVGAGGDRSSLRLRQGDIDIILATSAANCRTVVGVVAAGAVIMEEWKSRVSAILMTWYSGSEGGHALADVLLGHTDASGRLPFSIPTHESHLPAFDREASSIRYDRWHGQDLLNRLSVKAAFPLGYGLSYAQFTFGQLQVPATANNAGIITEEMTELLVDVTNTSSRKGRHVVQVYGRPLKVMVQDFPQCVLLGFLPTELGPGESKEVRVSFSLKPLKRWVSGNLVLIEKEVKIEVASFSGDPSAVSVACALQIR